MTDASEPSPGTPHDVLAGLDDLTRKVRAAQRGTWFPLLLFGVITLGGILVNRFTFSTHTITCPAPPGSVDNARQTCLAITQGWPLYLTLGSALAYIATAIFYIRRSRNRGVGTPVRPYVLTGIGLIALNTATFYWNTRHGIPLPGEKLDFLGMHLDPASGSGQFLQWLDSPDAAIPLSLLVLSWVERNRALLLFTLAYLAIELAIELGPIRIGSMGLPVDSPWMSLPRIAVPGVFLLLGALGFALAPQSRQRNAS
jgi:hypothetical protein